jgi:hypothetical protein
MSISFHIYLFYKKLWELFEVYLSEIHDRPNCYVLLRK